jgi:hypothetical protein|nr:hypothetical protein [Neorhizobium tomejilense]
MTSQTFDFSQMSQVKSSLSPGQDDHTTERAEREETFRAKVSMQQFMNHNGPIFKAFAYKGIGVGDVVDGDILLGPTEAAANLSTMVARHVLKDRKGEVTARDMSFFRTEAANWVAERWVRGESYDIDAAAKAIAEAVSSAGREWDFDPYKDDRISNDASLMMSAAGVTSRLMDQVKVYDFRVGRNETLKRLLDAVIGTAVEVSSGMLPKSASKNDVANLIQTVSRNFASIMEAIYERKAREVVGLLDGRETAQKTAWLDANRPLDAIIGEFKEWALCFVGFAVATSARISAPVPEAAAPSYRGIER